MEEGDLFWKLGLNNRYLLRKKKQNLSPYFIPSAQNKFQIEELNIKLKLAIFKSKIHYLYSHRVGKTF